MTLSCRVLVTINDAALAGHLEGFVCIDPAATLLTSLTTGMLLQQVPPQDRDALFTAAHFVAVPCSGEVGQKKHDCVVRCRWQRVVASMVDGSRIISVSLDGCLELRACQREPDRQYNTHQGADMESGS